MNYFQLLNINQSYDIDLPSLQVQYLALQVQHHPDKFNDVASKHQNLSISINLNKAYLVLKDDWTRAEHLLFLHGVNIDNLKMINNLSPAQLSQIWHDLEMIDNTNDLKILEPFYTDKMTTKNQIITDITSAFSKLDLQSVIGSLVGLKYLNTLLENLKLKIQHANRQN